MIAGCGTDLFINIILTFLGYASLPSHFPSLAPFTITNESKPRVFPGHIHAFYLEFVYFDRRDRTRLGTMTARRAPFVFSENVQNGGAGRYGTGGY